MEARLRLFALVLLAGCGSAAPTTDLPAGWDVMEGAVGAGHVEMAEPSELRVHYAEPPADLARTWTHAAEAGGWKVGEPIALPTLTTWEMTRGDEHLEMVIAEVEGHADVLVTK